MVRKNLDELNDEWVVFRRKNGDIVHRRRPPEPVRGPDEHCVIHSFVMDEENQKWICCNSPCDYSEDASHLFKS